MCIEIKKKKEFGSPIKKPANFSQLHVTANASVLIGAYLCSVSVRDLDA